MNLLPDKSASGTLIWDFYRAFRQKSSEQTDRAEEPDRTGLGKGCSSVHGERPSALRPAAGMSRIHSDKEGVRRLGKAHQSGGIKSTAVSLLRSTTFVVAF